MYKRIQGMVKKTLRFRLTSGKGSVQEFVDPSGVVYKPGDVVDLPPVYEGEAWLKPVDPAAEVSAVPGKIEPVEAVDPQPELQVPLEDSKTKRTRRQAAKKSES